MAKFAKGVSGNPGGRPRGYGDIKTIARRYTGQAITTLAKIMSDSDAPANARVAAATALLDRGWGRPNQTIEATISQSVSEVDAALSVSVLELIPKLRNDTPSPKTGENAMLMAEGGNA